MLVETNIGSLFAGRVDIVLYGDELCPDYMAATPTTEYPFFPNPPFLPGRQHTEHTMLAGEGATAFAAMMGMPEADLGTDDSHKAYRSWKENSCQPNYYRNFDGAESTCPPYDAPTSLDFAAAMNSGGERIPTVGRSDDPARLLISENNHDTIGMIVIDERGDLACGTTTNGAANKIAGRVGDSPVAGAGCYVDNDVGGAAATGDGDVMMRYDNTRDWGLCREK